MHPATCFFLCRDLSAFEEKTKDTVHPEVAVIERQHAASAPVTTRLPLTSACRQTLQLGQQTNLCDPNRQVFTPEHANEPCSCTLACARVEIRWHLHLFSEIEAGVREQVCERAQWEGVWSVGVKQRRTYLLWCARYCQLSLNKHHVIMWNLFVFPCKQDI